MAKKIRKNNTGSFRKLASGAFELSVSLGYDERKKRYRKYKTVYVETEQEAEEKLKKFINENLENCTNERTRFFSKIRNR